MLGLHMCVAYASLILCKQNIFCDLIMILRQILTGVYVIAAAYHNWNPKCNFTDLDIIITFATMETKLIKSPNGSQLSSAQ